MLFGAILATALAIQKIMERKPISRENDPTIPPVSANAF